MLNKLNTNNCSLEDNQFLKITQDKILFKNHSLSHELQNNSSLNWFVRFIKVIVLIVQFNILLAMILFSNFHENSQSLEIYMSIDIPTTWCWKEHLFYTSIYQHNIILVNALNWVLNIKHKEQNYTRKILDQNPVNNYINLHSNTYS